MLQHVSVHVKPSSGSHIQCLAKITDLVPMYQICNFSKALDMAPWWWFYVNWNMLEHFL